LENRKPVDLRDRKRGVFFILLILVTTVAFVLFFGPFGVLGASALGLVLAYLYRQTTPGRRKPRKIVAGKRACPECGSLQTDVVSEVDDQGLDLRVFHCFRCDFTCDPHSVGLKTE